MWRWRQRWGWCFHKTDTPETASKPPGGRDWTSFSPQPSAEPALSASAPRTSRLQNWEAIPFCGWSCSVCGALLGGPRKQIRGEADTDQVITSWMSSSKLRWVLLEKVLPDPESVLWGARLQKLRERVPRPRLHEAPPPRKACLLQLPPLLSIKKTLPKKYQKTFEILWGLKWKNRQKTSSSSCCCLSEPCRWLGSNVNLKHRLPP